MSQLRLAVAALALFTVAAPLVGQDQQPAGTTPAPDGVITSNQSTEKTKKTRSSQKAPKAPKESKKDAKVQQSKETRRDLKRISKDNPLAGLDSNQPDKQLYDKALAAVKKGRFDLARLELQTLLATYPDSEYQMRAKLAFADSWYREGGTSALNQAETEYKDFITFFPNSPEAAEAQLRVGDIYFKQMDTPDRDYTKALNAQDEYRTMLQQFPDSPLTEQARQRLREVQEVLATRESDIAAFYAGRENRYAAIARYQTVADTYPLFSHADEVLIGLGDAYAAQARQIRNPLVKLPEGARAALIKIYEDDAAEAYGRVVTQYAAAPHVEDARDRLETLGRPIPTPTPEQLAASQALESSRQNYHLKDRVKLLVFRGPDTVAAPRVGEPSLSDPKATVAPAIARRTQADFEAALNPNGSRAPIAPAAAPADDAAAAPATGGTAPAAPAAPLSFSDVPAAGATDSTGSAADLSTPAATTNSGGAGSSVGVEIINPATHTTPPPAGENLYNTAPAASNTALPPVEAPAAAPDQVNAVADQKTPAGQAAPANGKKAKDPFDKGEESSSTHKKKKGLKKINPF